MTQFQVEIKDPDGFHLRSASYVVKEAKKYDCDIQLSKGDKAADAKNAFSILELKIHCGDTITLSFDGDDAEEAATKMQAKLEGKL